MRLDVLRGDRGGFSCVCGIGDLIVFINCSCILVVESIITIDKSNCHISSNTIQHVSRCADLLFNSTYVKLRWDTNVQELVRVVCQRAWCTKHYWRVTINHDVADICRHIAAGMY